MLKSYSGSNGPGSGDIGGSLEESLDAALESPAAVASDLVSYDSKSQTYASLEFPAAVAPPSAPYQDSKSHTYNPRLAGVRKQEQQEPLPEYPSSASNYVDTKDAKIGLPSSHDGARRTMEMAWRSATLQPASSMAYRANAGPSMAPIPPPLSAVSPLPSPTADAGSSYATSSRGTIPPPLASSAIPSPIPVASPSPLLASRSATTMTRSNTRSAASGIKLHSSDKDATFGHE